MRKSVLLVTELSGEGDITAPTCSISVTGITAGVAAVTVTFSEAVTGFIVGDITVANATLANFATADNIVFTVDATIADGALATFDVAAGVCTDAAGNPNTAAERYYQWWFSGDMIYVATTGSDSAPGDGTRAHPYKTLVKALSVFGAGDGIIMGDGVYTETSGSGYIEVAKNLASTGYIVGERGADADVTIKGTSSNFEFIFQTSNNLTFRYLKFTMRATSVLYIMYFFGNCTNILFEDCVIPVTVDNSTFNFGMYIAGGNGYASGNITFRRCDWLTTGVDSKYIPVYMATTGTGTITTVLLDDCTIQGRKNGVYVNGATGVTIQDCLVSANSGCAIQVGIDGEAGGMTSTVSIDTVTVTQTTSGHGVILGHGSLNCVVDALTISSCVDYALVLKESAGHEVTNCDLTGGTQSAVLCKAATGVNIHVNTLRGTDSNGLMRLVAGGTGNKNGTVTFTDNELIPSGAGKCLGWGDSTVDNGGGVCDRNTYHNNSGLGIVRADTDVQSLLELQAAWTGYDVANNDTHSTVV